jgi:hypothetical protein
MDALILSAVSCFLIGSPHLLMGGPGIAAALPASAILPRGPQ